MTVTKIATSAIAALSLLGVSTVAAAAPAASKLSIAPARAGAKVVKKNRAIETGIIIAVLAAGAVVAGAVVAADNNNDSPTSR